MYEVTLYLREPSDSLTLNLVAGVRLFINQWRRASVAFTSTQQTGLPALRNAV